MRLLGLWEYYVLDDEKHEFDTSNVFLLDIEGIQHIAPDYLTGLQPEIDKCEHIIHEEISRFVSDNKRRRELNTSLSYT